MSSVWIPLAHIFLCAVRFVRTSWWDSDGLSHVMLESARIRRERQSASFSSFETQLMVGDSLRGRVVVGHTLKHDFRAMLQGDSSHITTVGLTIIETEMIFYVSVHGTDQNKSEVSQHVIASFDEAEDIFQVSVEATVIDEESLHIFSMWMIT